MAGPPQFYYIGPGSLSALPGVATALYSVTLTDSSGQITVAPAGGQAFTLSDGGSGGVFTPASVTVLAGASVATFSYSNAAPGPYLSDAPSPYILTALPNGGPLAGLPQSQQLPGVIGITAQAYISKYARWPILPDAQQFIARTEITLIYTPSQSVIDGIIRLVQRKTLRQFVADRADTSRIYDGTGTAEIETDEIVCLTGVTIIGYQSAPGYTLANVAVVQEQHKPQTRLVCARGSLPALVGEGYIAPYPTQFPAGRRNIQATGIFGYGPLIPEDLWNAVAGEYAYRLAGESVFEPEGQTLEVSEGDERVKFGPYALQVLGWHQDFMERLEDYRRPAGRRLRNLYPRPIA